MTIHREGYATLSLTAGLMAALILTVGHFFPLNYWLNAVTIVMAFVLFLVVLQFFRHPKRAVGTDGQLEGSVIAPADGKVVVIEQVQEDEFLNGPALMISIFMSPINVHVNRSPVTGPVEYFKYHPGKYLVAWHPKSSTDNERTSLGIRDGATGHRVFLRQIAGALARRIVCYARPGQSLERGGEFGFIKFGSRVDVFLPVGSEVLVKLGDKTRGGEQVIARLPGGVG